MPKRNLAASRLYILIFDYMQDLYQSVQLISENCTDHLNNFHSQPSKEFLKTSEEIERALNSYTGLVCEGIGSSVFKSSEKILEQHDALVALISKAVDRVITEIQKEEVGNRIGQLQMKLLLETKDILTTIHSMYGLYHEYHKQVV